MQPDWSKATQFVETDAGRLPILPTIVQDSNGLLLSLVWSSPRSYAMAIERQLGIYESRKRGLWVKSPSGVNQQKLLEILIDCDGDSLLFIVEQRGDACHLERKSCFESAWKSDRKAFHIGVCSGRGMGQAFALLQRVGIYVYKEERNRSTVYLVKTHLRSDIQIVLCKSRDLQKMLEDELIDLAVGFSDCFSGDQLVQETPLPPQSTVDVVLFGRAGCGPPNAESQVLSEYDLDKWPGWKQYSDLAVNRVHGNVEAFVAQGLADYGVAVRQSGETLAANGLVVIALIAKAELSMYFLRSKLSEEPRLFRAIRNDLQNETIYFYSVDGPYGFMSNFYPCKCGEYNSSEHYYQSAKFRDPELALLIKEQPTAKQCYKTAYLHQAQFRSDWHDLVLHKEELGFLTHPPLVKDLIMWKALQLKFANPELAAQLASTGRKHLVEHAMRDSHFGCGANGKGKNVLGEMLVAIRDFLLSKQ